MSDPQHRLPHGPNADTKGRAAELRAWRVPFVMATVVRAERPTSAKAGDVAVVLADGTVEGFVGGECAEASVRHQALAPDLGVVDPCRAGATRLWAVRMREPCTLLTFNLVDVASSQGHADPQQTQIDLLRCGADPCGHARGHGGKA